MNEELIEGEDFYFDKNNYFVFTEKYHLKRGSCCGNGCKHCPYNYENVEEPKRSELIANKLFSGKKEKDHEK